jgi:hypothetical protein
MFLFETLSICIVKESGLLVSNNRPVASSGTTSLLASISEAITGFLFETNNPDSLKIQIERVLNKNITLSELSAFPKYRSFADLGMEMEKVYSDLIEFTP